MALFLIPIVIGVGSALGILGCGGNSEEGNTSDSSAPPLDVQRYDPLPPNKSTGPCATQPPKDIPLLPNEQCSTFTMNVRNFPATVELCHAQNFGDAHHNAVRAALEEIGAFTADRMQSVYRIPNPSDHVRVIVRPVCGKDAAADKLGLLALNGDITLDDIAGTTVLLRPAYLLSNSAETCTSNPSPIALRAMQKHMAGGLTEYFASAWLPDSLHWLAAGLSVYETGAYQAMVDGQTLPNEIPPWAPQSFIWPGPFPDTTTAPTFAAPFTAEEAQHAHNFTANGTTYDISWSCTGAATSCDVFIHPAQDGGGVQGLPLSTVGACRLTSDTQLMACRVNGSDGAAPTLKIYRTDNARMRTEIDLAGSTAGSITEQRRVFLLGSDGLHQTDIVGTDQVTYDLSHLSPESPLRDIALRKAAGLTIVGLEQLSRTKHERNDFFANFGNVINDCQNTSTCATSNAAVAKKLGLSTESVDSLLKVIIGQGLSAGTAEPLCVPME